jgi:pimeloyl-ACP methyl ester carboxylesterase
MADARLEHLEVGAGGEARRIAVLRREGASPGVVWLGGFRSDMAGTKAEALDAWAAESGHACTRFDYSGHGRSEGRFEDGTISRWLEEAEAVLERFAPGPQVLVGSSMGGWVALLLAQRLRERGEGSRLAGIVLIAPAVDMTKDLIWDSFDEAARRDIQEKGFHVQPSAYSDEPYVFTCALIEDGERHLFGDRPIETGCPVHVIQGMQDDDVPWTHATALMERLAFDDAVLTLVRDGDHRLSRPEDIERLTRIVAQMMAG